MKEDRPKATHKIKKKSQGGFYSEFASYNPKGKSFAQIMLMIEDLRKNVAFQLTRISKLKYVVIIEREKNAEKISKVRAVLRRRNKRIDNLLDQIKELKGIIRKLKIEKRSEERKVEYRNRKIKLLERDLNKKPEQVTVEVERKPTVQEKAVIRATELPIDVKVSELSSAVYKTEMFLRKESLTLKQLGLLLQSDVTNGFYLSEVEYERKVAERVEELGLISSGFVGIKSNRKFYTITPKGKNKVNDYKNWISYSKTYI